MPCAAQVIGTRYEVWRGTTPDVAQAVQVASWLEAPEFYDVPPEPGRTNWYWIRGFEMQRYVTPMVQRAGGSTWTFFLVEPGFTVPTTVQRGVPSPVRIQDHVSDYSEDFPVTLYYAHYTLRQASIFTPFYDVDWSNPVKQGSSYHYDHQFLYTLSDVLHIGNSVYIDLRSSWHYRVPWSGPWDASYDWGPDVTVQLVDELDPAPLPSVRMTGTQVHLTWPAFGYCSHFSDPAVPVGSDWSLSLEADPADGGRTDGAGRYANQTWALISAQPSEGFRFASWAGAQVANSNSASTVIWMVSDSTVTARFVRGWELQTGVAPDGSGTVMGSGWYDEGTTATVVAVEGPNHTFNAWDGDGVANRHARSTTVTMNGPRSIVARFVPLYSLQVRVSPPSGGVAGGGGIYPAGTNVPIWATPQDGWYFGGWLGRDIADPGAMATTVHMLDSQALTAQFFNDQYGRIEYFVDHDPGYGNGVRVPFDPGSAVQANFRAVLTGLTYGVHTLYVRAQDGNGNWGLAATATFAKEYDAFGDRIARVEYFHDHDPGPGLGSPLWQGVASTVTFTNRLSITNLSPGVHISYIRACDERGNWGPPLPILFDHGPWGGSQLNAIEYFADTDPGAGGGLVTMFNPTAQLTLPIWMSVRGQEMGAHTLYIRGRSLNGIWGPALPFTYSHEPDCLVLPRARLEELRYSIMQGSTQYVVGSVATNSESDPTMVMFSPDISPLEVVGEYDLTVAGVGPDGIPGHEYTSSFQYRRPPQLVLGSPVVATMVSGENAVGESFDLVINSGVLGAGFTGFGTLGTTYLNYDATNLYVGGVGLDLVDWGNFAALFIGINTLPRDARDLLGRSGLPNGLDVLENLRFSRPVDLAILIGDEYGDGNYPNFNLGNGANVGQGIFYLNEGNFEPANSTLSQYDGTTTNATLTQDDDGNRQTDRWEAKIPWTSLGAANPNAVTQLLVCGVILGGTSGSDRYISGNSLAEAVVGPYDGGGMNYGFNAVTVTPWNVQIDLDLDRDGLPNWWEQQYGLDPAMSNGSAANADSDESTDTEEYIADTNPTNPGSFFPKLTNVVGRGVSTACVDPTSRDRIYDVFWKTDLQSESMSWTPFGFDSLGNGGEICFSFTNSGPQIFIRTSVRLP